MSDKAPVSDLRARVTVLAEEWNNTAVPLLAAHPEVVIAEVHRGRTNSWEREITYRFTLPTGEDCYWNPRDGWGGPSTTIERIIGWVRVMEADGHSASERELAALELVEQFQAAPRINVGGDPGGVTPVHVAQLADERDALEAERDRYKLALMMINEGAAAKETAQQVLGPNSYQRSTAQAAADGGEVTS